MGARSVVRVGSTSDGRFAAWVAGGCLCFLAFASGAGLAALGDCGHPVSTGDEVTAADSLFILLAAVGINPDCDPWVCDVDGNGSVAAGDSLRVLQRAVGIDVSLACPLQETTTTTVATATTTTTLGDGAFDVVCANQASTLTLDSLASRSQVSLSGELSVHCDAPGPDGESACTCTLVNLDPVLVTGGVLCVESLGSCGEGRIRCDGGGASGMRLLSDHNLGACSDNASCETQCREACQSEGFAYLESACEGFCQEGVYEDGACASRQSCDGSWCAGATSNAHGNVCGCHCKSSGEAAAPRGDLSCGLDVRVTMEEEPPCGDGDVNGVFGEHCIGLTTATLGVELRDVNNKAGTVRRPAAPTGAPVTCEQLRAGDTANMVAVGGSVMFDTYTGDLSALLRLPCQ